MDALTRDAAMRAQLRKLHDCLLETGILAAQFACSDTERTRVALCAQQWLQTRGPMPPNMDQLGLDLTELTNSAARYAQAIISRAAAAPEDPRHS